MRRQVGFLAIILCTYVHVAAAAPAGDSSTCTREALAPNKDLMITNCTDAIQSWRGTAELLAVLFDARGIAYYEKGLTDKAIEDFNQAIKLNPGYAQALSDRGNAYSQSGRYDLALQDYDQAIRLKADYAEAYNNRANIYFQNGDFDRALQDVDKAIDLNPTLSTAVFNRAMLYAAKHDCARAMKDFATAKRLNENYQVPDGIEAACAGSLR